MEAAKKVEKLADPKLEEGLRTAFAQFAVRDSDAGTISNYLAIVKKKDLRTYEHSISVGLLAARIGVHMHLDPKALLFGGLLHDVGKCLVDPSLLSKAERFTEEDMAQMRSHPLASYQLLRGSFDFTAEVALRHHRFQGDHSYPEALPAPARPFSNTTKAEIEFYAMLVSIADFYDAASTRENEKFGERRTLSADEVKQIMLSKVPNKKLVEDLFANGILGG